MNKIQKFLVVTVFAFLPAVSQAKDGDIKVNGTIETLSPSAVMLTNNVTYLFTNGTEFENSAGQNIGLQAFKVGQYVEIKYLNSQGNLVVREMELKGNNPTDDDSNSSGNNGSNGNGNNGGGITSSTNLNSFKKSLSAIIGVNTQSFGRIQFKSKPKEDRLDERWIVKAYIPLPSAVPNLSDSSGVFNLEIKAVLSRAGTPYAECLMPFDHFTIKAGRNFAEFKSDVRKRQRSGRSDRFDSKNGSYCDVDLNTAGVQNDLPAIQSGDLVVVSEAVVGNFLSGFIN